MVSALTGRKVKGDIAMTGEITLRGRVLPIGGLREKSMAAYREGVTEILIPHGNLPDLQEIAAEVKDNIRYFPVKELDEVLREALLPAEA